LTSYISEKNKSNVSVSTYDQNNTYPVYILIICLKHLR